ncbi:YdaS family helix-turn-helix protein [Xanthomonas oryzae]|uniref:YdaS family helix-turn-helix protein n=1 Tax=Xanthomonas oryzae TaxID=347 RepID=UPI00065542F9|nr:YdaS family helix-turn-helix protein [Xanthomonas oryzae]AKO18930.1 hypothetical protein ACU11_05040 [Xanthomonas oryzae pv. oryzicola]PUE93363.1 hypothetical protein C7T79_13600 [Xanthomonas oryzae pv. oryzicola]
MDMPALDQAIAAATNAATLARALGIKQPSICGWYKRGQVPSAQCPAIEALTGVSCEQLRPDVHWHRDEAGRVTAYSVPLQPRADQAQGAIKAMKT